MTLSPWCRDRATGREDGKSDSGRHWLSVWNTKYEEIVPGKNSRAATHQSNESSGEERGGRAWKGLRCLEQHVCICKTKQRNAGRAHERTVANTKHWHREAL